MLITILTGPANRVKAVARSEIAGEGDGCAAAFLIHGHCLSCQVFLSGAL